MIWKKTFILQKNSETFYFCEIKSILKIKKQKNKSKNVNKLFLFGYSTE